MERCTQLIRQIKEHAVVWGGRTKELNITFIISVSLLVLISISPFAHSFDFTRQLFGEPSTLHLIVADINKSTGKVIITGGDTQQPALPFTWDWGDGIIHNGWFPQQHTYTDVTKNYMVKVTAHYSSGKTDSAETAVRFVSPAVQKIPLPPEISVIVPDHHVTLESRMPGYGTSNKLTYFEDTFFNIIPRETVEYVLTVAASIQKDFVNDNVYQVNGGFHQVVIQDPLFKGLYSLWYTAPVGIGCGAGYGFKGTIEWSSLLHEMGHNFTLNTPCDYHFGGKIDGSANAIFSESMAQIFQHATAYEMINNFSTYGLSSDMAFDIEQSALSSIKFVRDAYESYRNSGMKFCSWNDPGTPEDETLNTFMTIAYTFCAHAESAGMGYRIPLKKMLEFFQTFNEDLKGKYDQHRNTAAANAFRATFMVSALSYAFSTDLRAEFTALQFPINDQVYDELMALASSTDTVNRDFFKDHDNDGYGAIGDSKYLCAPAGEYRVTMSSDCDDNDPAINPGAGEVCDEKDNNCNGQIDEGAKNTFYRDADGDAYGNPGQSLQACAAPSGYVANRADCDDENTAIHPGAFEVPCNGKDDDCAGGDDTIHCGPPECSEDDSGSVDIAGTRQGIRRQVRVPVRIQQAAHEVTSLGLEIAYDADILEYSGFEPGELAGSFDQFEVNPDPDNPGRLIIGGISTGSGIPQGASGGLVRVKFTVKSGQADACYPIQVQKLTDDLADFFSSRGCFCIRSCNGDLSGDGEVTPVDALAVFRCYLKSGPCSDCADVNEDGSVTPRDALCLFQEYLGQPSCLD